MSSVEIRPFRNSDPPLLIEVWRSQPPQRGLAQFIDANLLEALVFAKPYFDPAGLLIGLDNHRPLGFVHAGFGCDESRNRICTEMGVTCLLLVHGSQDHDRIGRELLAAAEGYLRARGAKTLYGGAIRPLDPFYLGLYGGSELPGILRSDAATLRLFQSASYRIVDECAVLHCDLSTFRIPIDRQQLMHKRNYRITPVAAPAASNWWDACTSPPNDAMQFDLFPGSAAATVGRVQYWFLDPLARGWGSVAAGLIHLEIDETHRRIGLGTYLVAESLRQLRVSGVNLVEVQTMRHNEAALALYAKLGFREVDQGVVLRKES